MASSGSVFSETLQTITTTKLEELAEQRLAFEKKHESLLEAASKEQDLLKRLFLLADGAKTCLNVMTAPTKGNNSPRVRILIGATSNPRLETDLKNLDRFLEQTKYDPSVSPKVLENWEKTIHQYLAIQSTKYQYADLYGKLVTEWLSSEKSASADSDIEMTESYEEVPGAKKLESRTEWEKVVFEPAQVDVPGLQDYLQQLFITDKKDTAKAIRDLREKVEQFESSVGGPRQFDVPTLRWVIPGLESSDLLSNEKREVLKDFLSNDVILSEIADVLNMRMVALDRWSWGDHVPLEQRRKLNGSYSIHMHEDLLQAIFLQYIGIKWSVFFKKTFDVFRQNAWKKNETTVPQLDRLRRQYYLGTDSTERYPNLEQMRAKKHKNRYFAHQLLDFESQNIEFQEGEEEAEFQQYAQSRKRSRQDDGTQHAARQYYSQQHLLNMQQQQQAQQQMHAQSMAVPMTAASYMGPPPPAQAPSRGRMKQTARRSARSAYDGDYEVCADDDDDNSMRRPKRPMQAKQDLLHILSTEIVLNTRLHGELTCFRSVFDSWNPLLPHDTVLAVLEFLGVSQKWRHFFKTFLQAPLKFIEDRDPTPRLRRRGTPGSHTLSDVFGEVVFTCLDFSINQATEGGMLHRLYDDIWFWSKDYEKCAKAWDSTLQFTKVMGVQLDSNKTGSIRVGRDTSVSLTIDDRLPDGQIRWGFLYLDSTTGRFEIDEKMVDDHIEELRKQLQGKSKSVIDWIQAWNTYAATFFSSNFGKAANCFGREHVDKMLATHRRIQETIFDGGNVTQFLKQTISQRFAVDNVPDGFLFFPVELGGLDLKSPFINLLQIRESVVQDPANFLTDYQDAQRDDYTEAKRIFDTGEIRDLRYDAEDPKFRPSPTESSSFLPFEEFTRYGETYASQGKASLVKVYRDLLKRPSEESIDVSVQVQQAVEQLRGQSNLRGITGEWVGMEAYWKWVAQMYGPEMVERFGGLSVVDKGLLPVGMVSLFRQKRVRWQG